MPRTKRTKGAMRPGMQGRGGPRAAAGGDAAGRMSNQTAAGTGRSWSGGIADGAHGEHRDAARGAKAMDGGGLHVHDDGAGMAGEISLLVAVSMTSLAVIRVPACAPGARQSASSSAGSEKFRATTISPSRNSGGEAAAEPGRDPDRGRVLSRNRPDLRPPPRPCPSRMDDFDLAPGERSRR